MDDLKILEITSNQLIEYKTFLTTGLINDEENFRITATDDQNASFPTQDKADSFTLGAYVNKELAGVVSFAREGINREKLRHKGLLFRMYVAKDFRGKGIAKTLLTECISRAKKNSDIEQINLTVITNNANAKALYEKCGFVTFSSEKNAIKWKDKYFDEDQMVLKIR